jgi:hypothetical protein
MQVVKGMGNNSFYLCRQAAFPPRRRTFEGFYADFLRLVNRCPKGNGKLVSLKLKNENPGISNP